MIPKQLEKILLDVQKPSQYIGGELNSVIKNREEVDVRLAFCFPDKYEVGMSHLGMKILYSLYNSRPNWWCERVFAPDADMEQKMRENNIALYGLEGGATVIVRPSGTEPKIKAYYTTLGKDLAEAQAQKETLAAGLKPLLD